MRSKLLKCVIALGILLPFQNCSLAKFGWSQSSDSARVKGGEGFDGKLYQSSNTCDKSVTVSDIVGVSTDESNAQVLRENCNDLTTPRPVPVADLQFAKN